MPTSMQELGIDRLDLDDRIALAEEIWESVARDVERAPLTDAQRRELERRLADSLARPESMTPWEGVKAQALNTLRERSRPPAITPQDEWERLLLGASSDCGVSLPHSALSSDEIYD